MPKFGRAGSTFATVITAVVVLVVATTTGAVAGALITSKQIKNNTIKSVDVKDGALMAADIANGAITGGKLGVGSVTATKLGTIVTRTNSTAVVNGDLGAVQATCAAGERVISGGVLPEGDGWNLHRSSLNGNGWFVTAHNNTGGDATLTVEAYCLQ